MGPFQSVIVMRSKIPKGSEDSQDLIREAMKNPGVAEAVRIYSEYEKMILRGLPSAQTRKHAGILLDHRLEVILDSAEWNTAKLGRDSSRNRSTVTSAPAGNL